MEAGKKTGPWAAATAPGDVEGTGEMGYWEFRKEVCAARGWQLRRISSQTYEAIDGNQQKIAFSRVVKGISQAGNPSMTPRRHPRTGDVALRGC
jgi:hypothetical protein